MAAKRLPYVSRKFTLRPWHDITAQYAHLQMTNSWRALARMSRDRIVQTDPEDIGLILNVSPRTMSSGENALIIDHFQLWYIRLSSLARLRLFAQTTAELNNLYTALSQAQPPSNTNIANSSQQHVPATQQAQSSASIYQYIIDNILPFELEVLKAKTRYWAGDHMGYLDELMSLLNKCKMMARKAGSATGKKGKGQVRDEQAVNMWKERGSRICLIMASQLIEMRVSSSFRILTSTPSTDTVSGLHSSSQPPQPSPDFRPHL